MKKPILSLVAGLCSTAGLLAAEKAPNFVIIYVDDLGWADTSVAMMKENPDSKSDFYQTPVLEKLAKRGVTFSNGYAPAPTCTPSRKSIQFGKTPARLGYTFVHDVQAIKAGLEWDEEVSMADVLKNSGKGYITAHFGKGMGQNRMETIGYDVTDEFERISDNGNFHGDYVSLDNKVPLPADDPKRLMSLEKSSVDFVREHAGKKPFFMMVSHYAVHVGHAARKELIEKYRNLPRGKYCTDNDYLPEDQMSKGFKGSSWRLQYAAMIEDMDIGLGKIIDEVEKAGELDNTYFIYTSDNGGGMKPNGPLSWGKAQLFEGGIRVPWVMAGPGIKEGIQCDKPVVQWDLLPTIHDFAACEQDLPEDLDGASLRSVLEKGNDGEVKRPTEGLVFHYPCYFAPPLSVIRLGDFKMMKHLNTGEMRLYDVTKDLGEKNNIAAQMPEKVAEMDKIMQSYLTSIDAEKIEDSYDIRLEMLATESERTTKRFEKETAKLDPGTDAAKIQKLKKEYETRMAFFKNRTESVLFNRTSGHFDGDVKKKK